MGTSSGTSRSRRGRGIGAAAAETVGETVGVQAQAPINLVKLLEGYHDTVRMYRLSIYKLGMAEQQFK